MLHTIQLIVTATTVKATPNPLPGVAPGDEIVWEVAGDTGRRVEVEFQPGSARFADDAAAPGQEHNPFTAAPRLGSPSAPNRVAAGRHGRFIYKVFADGNRLNWDNPIAPGQNFGGVDVPEPPPGR